MRRAVVTLLMVTCIGGCVASIPQAALRLPESTLEVRSIQTRTMEASSEINILTATIAVLQDLDPRPGIGAFWGEVQSNVHKALGLAGALTDGSFRDLDALASGFQILGGKIGPSHAHVHLEAIDVDVNIFGMTVRPGDLIHGDHHGAVVIPAEAAPRS